MPDTNPFQQVHDATWNLVVLHGELEALVKLGNRVKLDSRDPLKDEVSESDLPELILVPNQAVPHLQRTSNSSSIMLQLDWRLSTGEMNVEVLYEVCWELYRAMSKWQSTMTTLLWGGVDFVRLARPIQIAFGQSDADLNRGIVGWSSVWTGEVHMWFSTAKLQEV